MTIVRLWTLVPGCLRGVYTYFVNSIHSSAVSFQPSSLLSESYWTQQLTRDSTFFITFWGLTTGTAFDFLFRKSFLYGDGGSSSSTLMGYYFLVGSTTLAGSTTLGGSITLLVSTLGGSTTYFLDSSMALRGSYLVRLRRFSYNFESTFFGLVFLGSSVISSSKFTFFYLPLPSYLSSSSSS